MSERTKAVLSAVIILGCLALLGFLVKERAEGAAIAACAVVTTIVAWLTRTPADKGPPASLVPLIGIGAIIVMTNACSAFGGDKAAQAEDAYKAQQLKCVADYTTREQIDECRRVVREEWGIVETAAKDGGK